MTEEEWDTTTVPHHLIEQLCSRERLGRKRRLFACAGARLLFPVLSERTAEWIEVAEHFADRLASQEERRQVNQLAREDEIAATNPLGFSLIIRATLKDVSYSSVSMGAQLLGRSGRVTPYQLCRVIRDIFGNPFRSISFDESWRTSTAVAIANQMYESRDFSAMPILADALQDAGCDSDDILDHCRAADGVHVRGCWVVDLVLGKA